MLHELFERQARLTPHKLAVEGPDAHMSYAELNGRAHRIAQELAARGVRAGDFVAIFLERSAAVYASMYPGAHRRLCVPVSVSGSLRACAPLHLCAFCTCP